MTSLPQELLSILKMFVDRDYFFLGPAEKTLVFSRRRIILELLEDYWVLVLFSESELYYCLLLLRFMFL